MVETTVKIEAIFKDQNAPFDISIPLTTSTEPGLFLSLATFLRFLTGYGKHDLFDLSAFGVGSIAI
jgi:hypothetical protein